MRSDEIAWFEADGNLVVAHTDGAALRVERSIRRLEVELRSPPFFLARRGVIVNLDRVTEIEHGSKGAFVLVVQDGVGSRIPVSERQSPKLRALLDDPERGD